MFIAALHCITGLLCMVGICAAPPEGVLKLRQYNHKVICSGLKFPGKPPVTLEIRNAQGSRIAAQQVLRLSVVWIRKQQYSCLAWWPSFPNFTIPGMEASLINVRDPPVLRVMGPDHVLAEEGRNVILRVEVTGSPPPKTSWSVTGTMSQMPSGANVRIESLSFLGSRSGGDIQFITCNATDAVGHSMVEFTVFFYRASPRLLPKRQVLFFDGDDRILLEVLCLGVPLPRVKWSHGGTPWHRRVNLTAFTEGLEVTVRDKHGLLQHVCAMAENSQGKVTVVFTLCSVALKRCHQVDVALVSILAILVIGLSAFPPIPYIVKPNVLDAEVGPLKQKDLVTIALVTVTLVFLIATGINNVGVLSQIPAPCICTKVYYASIVAIVVGSVAVCVALTFMGVSFAHGASKKEEEGSDPDTPPEKTPRPSTEVIEEVAE